MIKNANEIIEETDEDLQLQAGMQFYGRAIRRNAA